MFVYFVKCSAVGFANTQVAFLCIPLADAPDLDKAVVVQEVEYVKQEAKLEYMLQCLQKTAPPTLIFAENKTDVDDIHEKLLVAGVEAVAVHGGKDQEERVSAIDEFKSGKKVRPTPAICCRKGHGGHFLWQTHRCVLQTVVKANAVHHLPRECCQQPSDGLCIACQALSIASTVNTVAQLTYDGCIGVCRCLHNS